jgi:hypothetical protein
MDREGTRLMLSAESAAIDRGRLAARSLSRRERDAQRQQRERMLLAALWLFIGLVAAYDTYLSIKFQETLRFQELNPVGRWLMEFDGGSVAAFMGCKFLGTLIVLGTIQLLYVYKRHIGLTVASALAGIQGMLALYLTFG